MAYLNKKAYESKREFAGQRMENNKKITKLTEEQHRELAELCSKRHEMHTCGDSMFYTESSYYDLHDYFREFDLEIKGIKAPNLNTEEWVSDFDYYIEIEEFDKNDYDDNGNYIYNKEIEEKKCEIRDRLLDQYFEQKEELNNKIESYLKNIDKKYGTNYCPTGASRIF